MFHTTIVLTPDYSKAGITHTGPAARLVTYIYDYSDFRANKLRPLILICPGGGFNHLSPREAEPIALKMNSLGYNVCVLYYSLEPNGYPCQLIEAAMAMDYIKKHTDKWHVDKNKICIGGFSAGAYVAGSIGTMWNDDLISDVLGGSSEDYRPACMLLCYPVITSGEYAHRESFDVLTCGNKEMCDTISLEKRVDDNTVPAFIWHTYEDCTVPVENSLLMALAMRKNNIPYELHIFGHGCHGLALANEETACASGKEIQPECVCWPELFAAWFKTI